MIKTYLQQKKETILVFLFALTIFGLYSSIVLNLNIHGDARFHTLYAKESAESGSLVQSQPYRIYDFHGDKRVYMPIAYPLTYESLFTIFYLFGQETLLKLYSPISATFIFLLVYLCIRELGVLKAALTATFGTLSISERLIMTPLMEPYLIILLLVACFLLKKFYQTNRPSLLYLSSFFLGMTAAIKQQGIILSFFVIFFIFCFLLYKVIKKYLSFGKFITYFLIVLFVFILTPFLAFKNQIDRTGTVAYAPGGTSINSSLPLSQYIQPLLNSRFASNPDAIQAIRDTIGYNKQKVNLLTKFKGFILVPFLYYRSSDANYHETYQLMIFSFILLAIFVGLFSRDTVIQKDKFILYLFLGLFCTEVISSYLFRTPITQYHSFGVLVTTVIIFFFILRFTLAAKKIRIVILSLFISFFAIGYATYIFPIWNQSGRDTDYNIEGYKRIGEFVQKNTSPRDIFLAPETSFRYYAKRDVVWLNESVGDTTRKIVIASNPNEAVDELAKLNIKYMVIEKTQIMRVGVNDYLPPDGLISLLNNTSYFTPIYDPYGDGEMIVYKVNYSQNKLFSNQ